MDQRTEGPSGQFHEFLHVIAFEKFEAVVIGVENFLGFIIAVNEDGCRFSCGEVCEGEAYAHPGFFVHEFIIEGNIVMGVQFRMVEGDIRLVIEVLYISSHVGVDGNASGDGVGVKDPSDPEFMIPVEEFFQFFNGAGSGIFEEELEFVSPVP